MDFMDSINFSDLILLSSTFTMAGAGDVATEDGGYRWKQHKMKNLVL